MSELHRRKTIRLKSFDYSKTGAYFITICVCNRECVLSKIVGEGSPLPRLTVKGIITEEWIRKMTDKYPEVNVDSYVIMPNHIHLLLSVMRIDGRGDPSPTVIAAVGWLKYKITKEINALKGTTGEKIFQRSFYDHVVRNREDYQEIRKYIHENPIRWKYDKLYKDE